MNASSITRRDFVVLTAALAGCAPSRPQRHRGIWPASFANRQYTVSYSESVGVFDTIRIPKDCTIRLADDVREIDWVVTRFEFEENATLDLGYEPYLEPIDPPIPAPPFPPPPPPAQIPGRPSNMFNGAKGTRGAIGIAGRSGRKCTLTITQMGVTGSLWIRTDGEKGWHGGKGGKGQLGGDGECIKPERDRAGTGGDGGDGGQGGTGGSTSRVRIRLLSLPSGTTLHPPPGPPDFDPSARPPGAIGNDGRFAAWGSRGAGGRGGLGGDPAAGGRRKDGCHCCITSNWSVEAGFTGNRGALGPDGLTGAFELVEILGP